MKPNWPANPSNPHTRGAWSRAKRVSAALCMASMMFVSAPGTANAWNAAYPNGDDPTDYRTDGKVHNFVLSQALEWLEQNGKLPFPGLHTPSAEGITPFTYLNFGLWMADHIWAGTPEDPYSWVAGVMDRKFDDNTTIKRHAFLRPAFPTFHPCNFAELFASTRYRYKIDNDGRRRNTYVEAEWGVAKSPGTNTEDDAGKEFGGDNMYHFFLNRVDWDRGVQDILVVPGFLIELGGTKLFDRSQIYGDRYGAILARMARNFWPGNFGRQPSMNDFEKYDKDGESGRITLKNVCRRLIIGDDPSYLKAELPTIYLGSNPYICDTADGDGNTDWCKDGTPTWPVWVPGAEKVVYRDGEPVLFQLEKEIMYHDALREHSPNQTMRASLVYLGWAAHQLGDLAVPDHAIGLSGLAHQEVEDIADEQLEAGLSDVDFLRSLPPEFDDAASKSRETMCADFGLPFQAEGGASLGSLQQLFANTAEWSEDLYGPWHEGADDTGANEELTKKIIKRSIQDTIKLLGCLGECRALLDNISYVSGGGVSGEYVETSCLIEARDVVVESGANLEFVFSERVVLKPGFTAEEGSSFTTTIAN